MARDDRPVLVITSLEDTTADDVIDELNRRGMPVVRLDPGDFPAEVTLSARVGTEASMHGTLRTASRTLDLSAVRAVYRRRPSPYRFDHLAEQNAAFASAQARYGLGGVLDSLPGALYVNHPRKNAAAEYKPVQLAVALDLGRPPTRSGSGTPSTAARSSTTSSTSPPAPTPSSFPRTAPRGASAKAAPEPSGTVSSQPSTPGGRQGNHPSPSLASP